MKLLVMITTLAAVLCSYAVAADPPGGKTTAPTTPALFGGTGAASLDQMFGDNTNDRWRADVEEALQYLHGRQEAILVRLDRVEQVLIRVQPTARTASPVDRSVPVSAGVGQFQLAPGETLVGYQDPLTGGWVNAAQTTTTTYTTGGQGCPEGCDCGGTGASGVRYTTQAQPPVGYYNTQNYTSVETTPVVAGPVRGRVLLGRRLAAQRGRPQVTMGAFSTCGPGGCN